MRPGQQNKRSRGRNNNNNNGGRKNVNPLQRSYESNGPDVKVRGNPATIAEKYVQLARDAQTSGDSVAAENYFQHAEHYFRIISAAQAQSQARQEQQAKERASNEQQAEASAPSSDNAPATEQTENANNSGENSPVAEGEENRRPRRAPRARRPRRSPADGSRELSDAPQPVMNVATADAEIPAAPTPAPVAEVAAHPEPEAVVAAKSEPEAAVEAAPAPKRTRKPRAKPAPKDETPSTEAAE